MRAQAADRNRLGRSPQRALARLVLSWCIGCGLAGIAHAQDIVLGQSLSLTGASGAIARDLLRGRQACVHWINAQGGIKGRTLKLVTRDDQGNTAQAVRHAQDLAEREGAVLMLGSMGPNVNTALLEWADLRGLAVVGPYGGDIEIRIRNFDTVYFLTANQSAEAQRLASHVASLGLRRVVVVHGSDPSGRAALTALEEGLGVSNVAAIALIAASPDGGDAAAIAQAVLATKAQAVLLATTGRATVALLQALSATAATGLPLLQVYGLSSSASQAELAELGIRARGFTMSQVVPMPRDTRVPLILTFQSAMREAAGDRTYTELEGCMAVLVVADVLRRKASVPTRPGVLQALKGAGRVSLGGFDVELGDKSKSGSQFTDIVYVGADGRIVR